LGENLVPNDTNASFDMFLFDRQTGVLERVSVSSGNVEGNNHSGYALYASTGNSVSADGRWVAFPSQASNLVAQDTNGMVDIFVRDRTLGTTKRVSVSSSGTQANNHSGVPWLSADGRWIAFGSFATNLVPGGSSSTQLLIHDRMLGTTELASADANGAQANFGAWTSALSANGRFVVFDTTSSNLVPGDLNGAWDVFLRERCGTVKSYCTAGVSTNGCAATLSSTGTPSASTGSGFTITASNVEGQKSGLLFYGINGRNDVPWGGGTSYLCVTFPVQRTATQNSGGSLNACDGVLAIDWNAYVAANPGALGNPFGFGQRVNAQVWFRDPPAPKTTNLSDGIEFTVCP
jgi:Tol biopolymer transport system component